MSDATEAMREAAARETTRFGMGNKAARGKGRPVGARAKVTLKVLEQLETLTDDLLESLRDRIAEGDVAAMRLVLDRVCPARRESPLPRIRMPDVMASGELPLLSAAVLRAASSGALSPHEASAFSSLISAHAQALAQAELVAGADDGAGFASISPDEIEERARRVREGLEEQRGVFLPERREQVAALREEMRRADSFSAEEVSPDGA